MGHSRIEYIDIAKGLGILLVYIGHCEIGTTNLTPIIRWIYSFHMPLFFFISGLLFKLKSHTSHLIFIQRKLISLWIPYFIFSVYNWCLLYCFVGSPGNVMITGWGRNPLWFIPILFFVNYIHFLFVHHRSLILKLFAFLILLYLFFWKLATNNWLLYSFSELPWFYLCFLLGYLSRKYFDLQSFSRSNGLCGLILFGTLSFFLNIFVLPNYPNYLHSDNVYICWVLRLMLGMIGTFATLLCCAALSKRETYLKTVLQWLGNNSLVILCTHKLYYEILQTVNYQPFLRGGYNHIIIWLLILVTILVYKITFSFINSRIITNNDSQNNSLLLAK